MKILSNWPYLAVVLSILAFLPLASSLWQSHALAAVGWLVAWLALVLVTARVARRGTKDRTRVTQDVDELSLALSTVSAASEAIWGQGPQAGFDDVRRAVVTAAEQALGTDQIALFTIDPCTAAIECECSADVDEAARNAFLVLYDIHQRGPAFREAWTLEDIDASDAQSAARESLADNGVKSILACPIRSEVSASGVLVAFFASSATVPESKRRIMETLTVEASAALSHSQAMEQSRDLMDGLADVNVELSVQATSDGLTGLANHRTFQQTISELCRKAGSAKRVFSLVMVDVDHFKLYNDTHGHPEGDAVLQRVAKMLASGMRQGDLAARYGGEEFAIILRNTDKDSAQAAADRIRKSIAEEPFRNGTVTVSMGVAEFPTDGSSAGELIENADKALYHAKHTGRNRVVTWGSRSGGCTDQMESDDRAEAGRSVLVVEGPHQDPAGSLAKTLNSLSYKVDVANGTGEAAELMRTRAFDIALVSHEALCDGDVRLLSSLTAIHPDMPTILVASELAWGDSREAMRRGVTDVLTKPFKDTELPLVIERNLERRRLELRKMTDKRTEVLLQAINALVFAIEAKDCYTAGHSDRVTSLSMAMSERLNLSDEDRTALELSAKLHDVGKIGLPDSSLNKESPLTEEEWSAMRDHPVLGSRIVGAIDELAYVSTIIRHHHERLDGTGYPDGLRGPTIPFLAQMIAVADAYEAMTSERAHRSRLSPSEAMEELERRAGTHYNPDIVGVLRVQLVAQGEITDAVSRDAAA